MQPRKITPKKISFWKRFKFKNIWKEPFSSLVGLVILYFIYDLVKIGKADIVQVIPVVLLIIPFLLYGKDTKSNSNTAK